MNAKAVDTEEVDDELTAALEADDADDDDTTAIDTIPVPRKAPSLALIRSLAAAPSARRSAEARVRSRVPVSGPPAAHVTSILPPPPAEPSEPFHLQPTAARVASEASAAISAAPGPASVAPVAWTERPPAPSNDQRAKLVFAGAGLLAVLGGVFWMLVIVSGGVALGTRRSSTLVVTTSGSDPAGGVEIFIDGTRQCREFPCRLDDLSRGAHLVHVATPARPPGKVQGPAALATPVAEASALPTRPGADDARAEPNRTAKSATSSTLAAGRASALHSPAKTARAAAKTERPNEKRSDDTSADSESAIPRGIAAVLAKSFPAPQPDAPITPNPAPPADGKGVLNLSASPRANVAVDGRPLGATPKSIRVVPGSHTVVFASGARRSVQRVVVKPGKTARLGVRF